MFSNAEFLPRKLGNFADKVEIRSWLISGWVDMNKGDVVPQGDLLLALGDAFLLVSLDAVFQCSLFSMGLDAEIRRRSVRGALTLEGARVLVDGLDWYHRFSHDCSFYL